MHELNQLASIGWRISDVFVEGKVRYAILEREKKA